MKGKNSRRNESFSGKSQRRHGAEPRREGRGRAECRKINFRFAPVEFDSPECPLCGQKIEDIAQAMSHKETGAPIHFDCALKALSESERLRDGEKIAYIGQGKFAVITYPNPRDEIHFKIERTIDWESKDVNQDWRKKISDAESVAQEITDIKPV